MRVDLDEVTWLDDHCQISLMELAELSGLSETALRELVELGIIVPAPDTGEQGFHAHYVVTARTACRLRNDFELDAQGLALALTLLERLHDLETQLRDLRARWPAVIR